MPRIFIAALFAVAGAIQLVWGYFFGEPLVPFISNWLHSKGYSQTNAEWIIGLICILIALLVWKFSKPKPMPEQKLEIEVLPCHIKGVGKYVCQIRVHNRSPDKSAEDVQVEVIDLDYFTEDESHQLISRFLLPAIKDRKTVNPGERLVFNLFYIPNASWANRVIAQLTEVVVESKEKTVLIFEPNKNYPLKIRVTARDFSKTEEAYSLNFRGDESRWHFTLTKINGTKIEPDEKVVRKQIKDSLAGFRIWIQALQGKLADIPYYSYYDEKKQKLEQDYLDMDNQAYRILKDKVGNSEAVSFADEQQIPKVNPPPADRFDMPAFRDRWIEHKFMSNRLEYKKQQLEKTEAKLDSKDFILPLETSPNLFV